MPLDSDTLQALIAAAQGGEVAATDALLNSFRPLLRSRMHALWSAVQGGLLTLEWDDIEAQINLLFLQRLQGFRSDAGVYFPYYIEKMIDLDARYWLRCQRRGAATPFSQLSFFDDAEDDEGSDWLFDRAAREDAPDEDAPDIDRNLALRAALDALPTPQREAVWQCCVLGRTEASVAEELGISRAALRTRLAVAIEAMRGFFGEGDDGEVGILDAAPNAKTRTGRIAKNSALAARLENGEQLIFMAKDEKRPDLVGVGAGRPVLLQGTFDFPATGLKTPELLSKKLCYTVPPGYVLGVRYLRLGSVSDGMIAVSTVVNGLTHRIVPCAANATTHVSFAIVEPFVAGSQIEIHIASQCSGIAILDVGCLQMPA